MRKSLTAALVEKTLPPSRGRVEISDALLPGLVLRVTSNGAKTFVVRSRCNGSEIRFYIGNAKALDLKHARELASSVIRDCQAGFDPREKRRLAELEAEKVKYLAVPVVIEEFLTRYVSKNKTQEEVRRIFENDVLPDWRKKLLSEVTRADVVKILDRIEDRASPYRANRVLAAIRKMFNWSVSRGLIDRSPIVLGMARKGEKARDRYLLPAEIRAVWAATDELNGAFGPAIKMLLITGQRLGEVSRMTWKSLDLESERLWSLTSDETKADRAHIVPLSATAIEILRKQPALGEFVFTTFGNKPIGGFGKAKQEVDELANALFAETASISKEVHARGVMPHWRLHDLRRTVATHMEDALGIPPHIVGSVLNHDPKGYKGITATYTRGSLLYDRRRALTAWARYLELVVNAVAWAKIEKLAFPETESDATRTEEFRRMIKGDNESWESYLNLLLNPAPSNVVALRQ